MSLQLGRTSPTRAEFAHLDAPVVPVTRVPSSPCRLGG